MTRHWRGSRLSRASFPAHVCDTHLFVALHNHGIEEALGLEMTKEFSRQVLISPRSSRHMKLVTAPLRTSTNVVHGRVFVSATLRMNM